MIIEINKKKKFEILKREILDCKKCDLYKTRNKPLVGDGSIKADIMFIGESPGYNEDIEGRAFVGEAGKILDLLLNIVRLERDKIYITNVLKCHPPKNHNPNRKQIYACIGYLYRQIDLIKPRIIVALGKYASKEIFTRYSIHWSRIGELHGKIFTVSTLTNTLRIIPMYHPAVACYHAEQLDVLKEDFKNISLMLK